MMGTFFYVTGVHAALTDPVSLWTTQTPAVVDSGDPGSVELGLKFQASLTGDVTGVKFYKSAANIGTHVGTLWDTSGNLLASVTFTGETASGWQTATFATPVHILANTTYVIAYFAPQGNFSIDSGYFGSSAYTNGPLTGLKSGTDGVNGVYAYNGSSTYPGNPSSNDNYWVDVVFVPDAVTAPVSVTATQYQNSVLVNWSAGTNSSEVTQYTVSRNGSPIGTVNSTTFQYTDTNTLQPGTTYTYVVNATETDSTTTGPSNTASVTYITANTSVKAIDSVNTINDPTWFTEAYAAGIRLYIMHSTVWGTCTPWSNTQSQLSMALAAGLKIAVYTHDPSCWQNGILAAGPYQDQLQFFALDVETDTNVAVTRAMVDGVKSMNVRPIIYSGSGMWSGVQGATSNDFSDVPLWDTNTSTFDYASWQANYLSPAPVPYGGWNTPSTMRIGAQQEFEYTLNGINVDLDSFDSTFLTVGDPVPPVTDNTTPVTQPTPSTSNSVKTTYVAPTQVTTPTVTIPTDSTIPTSTPTVSSKPVVTTKPHTVTTKPSAGITPYIIPLSIGGAVVVIGSTSFFIWFRSRP
jgi:hypothetical protein